MDKQCKSCQWELANGTKIDDTKTSSEWSEHTGILPRAIRRHRKNHHGGSAPVQNGMGPVPGTYRWDLSDDDFEGTSPASGKPATSNDVEDFLRERGLDPAEWDYTFRFSEWEQSSKDGGVRILNAFRVAGRRKRPSGGFKWEQAYTDHIRTLKLAQKGIIGRSEAIIAIPTDAQIGKTDWNGGTKETVDQLIQSFENIAAVAERTNPAEIVIIDAGDIIENIYNTSSQLATNDLSLPWQVTCAVEVILRGLEIIAPHTPKITYISVPSNHGSHRIGKQAAAGTVMDDWGLAIAKIIKIAAPQVNVVLPDDYHESVFYETCGTQLGVVHGHQANSPDRIGDWWKGQSHGNLPTARARILITGHWHSFRVQQSGDARWIFVAPASDRGSSWFTNVKGEQSQSGVLTFITQDNNWRDIQIL